MPCRIRMRRRSTARPRAVRRLAAAAARRTSRPIDRRGAVAQGVRRGAARAALDDARAKGALPDPHPLNARRARRRRRGGALCCKRADLVVALGLDTLEADALPEACWSSSPVLVFGPAAAPDGRMPAVHVVGDVSAIIEELAIRPRDKPRADWDVAEVDRLRRDGAARGAGDGSPRAWCASPVRRRRRARSRRSTRAPIEEAVATAWHAIAPREFLAANDLATRLRGCPPRSRRTSSIQTVTSYASPVRTSWRRSRPSSRDAARLAARIVVDRSRGRRDGRVRRDAAGPERGWLSVAAVDQRGGVLQAFGRALNGRGRIADRRSAPGRRRRALLGSQPRDEVIDG